MIAGHYTFDGTHVDMRPLCHFAVARLYQREVAGLDLDDPALRMKKYAPHLLKALDLESYEAVYGKHFLQEDSSRAIASLIAGLINALSSSME